MAGAGDCWVSKFLAFICFFLLFCVCARAFAVAENTDRKANPPQTQPVRHFQINSNKTLLGSKSSLLSSRRPRSLGGMMNFDSLEDDLSLGSLLAEIVRREMGECSLVLATNGGFAASAALQEVLKLPNFRQVVHVRSTKDLQRIDWTPNPCGGYLFLLEDSTPLLSFGRMDQHSWNYGGKFLLVGFSYEQLNEFTRSTKGKKTEHIVGITKSKYKGEYRLYMNQMFYGSGMVRINSWKNKRLTRTNGIFPDKIRNLHKAVLNVVQFELPPNIVYHRSDDGNQLLYGQEIELIMLLAKFFNFTINYQRPPPGEMWGEQVPPNNTWNGQVGMLGRGESDIAIGNRYITSLYGRFDFEHYSDPYEFDKSCYLVRLDPPLPRWQNLGLPFQWVTWLAILVGMVLTGPVLYVLAKASTGPEGSDPLGETLSYSCMFMVGLHFRVSQTIEPRNISIQILTAFMGMYATILTTAYCSNLTAFLTVNIQPRGVDSLRELRYSNLKVLSVGPLIGNLMSQSVNPDLKALTERFVSMPNFDSITEEMMARRGVMVQSRVFLEYMREQLTDSRGRSLVRIIKQCSFPFSVGLGYTNYSPLIRKFNPVINWIVESGLFRYWKFTTLRLARKFKIEAEKRMSASDKPHDDVPVDSGVIPLGIDHLQGIFIVLIFGLLISIIVFLVERYRSA